MKLSEFSTDRAADILCEISVYTLNILADEEFRGSLKKLTDAEKPQTIGEKYAIGVQRIGQWIPLLLKKHREDVFAILATMNGATVDAIREQTVIVTMRQIRELAEDKELIDFFKSCASEAKA